MNRATLQNHPCPKSSRNTNIANAVGRALGRVPNVNRSTIICAMASIAPSLALANDAFPPVFYLPSLIADGGTSGFILNTNGIDGVTGDSVSAAGDINGDGFDDVVIGKFNYNFFGAGADIREDIYIVFGQEQRSSSELELSSLSSGDGGDGFVAHGVGVVPYSNTAVASAGDVNGDGIDDFIIGSHFQGDDQYLSGQSYVVFGDLEGFSPEFQLPTLAAGDGTAGFVLYGSNGEQSGVDVTGVGDINGDGFDDILVGASTADANDVSNNGASYLVFGRDDFSPTIELANLASGNGDQGFVLIGQYPSESSGYRVSPAGDINDDGFDDIFIGTRHEIGGRDNAAYIVFGQESIFPATFELSMLANGDGTKGFLLGGVESDNREIAVDSLADINGDGIDDVIVGDPRANGTGRAYVVFGRDTGFPPIVNLSTLGTTESNDGFVIVDDNDIFDEFGASVSGAGDINADGFDDVIVNAFLEGAGYVIYGGDEFAGVISVAAITDGDGSLGFKIEGGGMLFQPIFAVSDAGDVNGDGIDDLILGMPHLSLALSIQGKVAVIYGRGADSDNDGVVDLYDNCTWLFNPIQWDSDQDGFGNRCDPDLNNDGIVNFLDFGLWAPFFNTSTFDAPDFDGNGVVNFVDLGVIVDFYLSAPGPSGAIQQ